MSDKQSSLLTTIAPAIFGVLIVGLGGFYLHGMSGVSSSATAAPAAASGGMRAPGGGMGGMMGRGGGGMGGGQASAANALPRTVRNLATIEKGDYFALLAYVEMTVRHAGVLQRLRHSVRDRAHVATCVGFGPRFLHSTGQAYKGGPNSGVFLQITCDNATDVPVPGRQYSFGVVKAAQARGDFAVLVERGRRALRVHLGSNLAAGLATLQQAITQALT